MEAIGFAVRPRLYTLLISFAICTPTLAANSSDEFCEGYKDGYRQGWCNASKQVDGSCLRPTRYPSCPRRRSGEKGYDDGYKRGTNHGAYDAMERYGD